MNLNFYLMVKNLLCRLFSRRNVKNSSEKQKIPHEDASLKKWQDFADRCDWKRVAEAQAKFIPRAYEPYVQHDDEVWRILHKRLLQFELPVLMSSFIQENVERFIFVEDGASFSRIKDEVYHFHVAICSPRFVVEECGKLRGFALSGELVIVGVALAGTHPENVEKLIQGQGLQLLTREDSKCVMMVIDLDYFKSVNDNHGHMAGNEVLLSFSQHLSAAVRKKDIVARFGGDEFVLLLLDVTGIEIGKQKAEEILRLQDNNYGVTKSIGMSLFPDMGRNYDELFRKADKALYQAKQKRNAYCVYGEE